MVCIVLGECYNCQKRKQFVNDFMTVRFILSVT